MGLCRVSNLTFKKVEEIHFEQEHRSGVRGWNCSHIQPIIVDSRKWPYFQLVQCKVHVDM